MLGRHERRSLDEIEKRLTEEEPELARNLASSDLPVDNRLLTVLIVVSSVMVVLCLILGEFRSFLLLTGLVVALLWTRRWRLRA